MKENHSVKFTARVELYRLLRDKPRGFFISYAELAHVLGRDPQRDGRYDVLWVRRKLIAEYGKWLEVEIGKGYFIAKTNQHDGAAQRYDNQAIQKQKVAVTIAANTEMEELTPDELRSFRDTQLRVGIKFLAMRRIDKAKPAQLDRVVMPSGHDLLEIYRGKKS